MELTQARKSQRQCRLHSILHNETPMPQRRTLLLCLLLLAGAAQVGRACEKTVRWANDPPYDMPDATQQVHVANLASYNGIT